LPARNRESARPGLDLGGRERRIVKIPAIQFLPVAIADRHRLRQQRAGGILAARRANDRFGAEPAEVVSRNERAGSVETRSKLIGF
jgi:hypothetical protein